jgi:hypothetical protein
MLLQNHEKCHIDWSDVISAAGANIFKKISMLE